VLARECKHHFTFNCASRKGKSCDFSDCKQIRMGPASSRKRDAFFASDIEALGPLKKIEFSQPACCQCQPPDARTFRCACEHLRAVHRKATSSGLPENRSS
jgi:hypothetical protein